ncbi:MAG TPA: hypothetical protein VFU38_07955, partial [Candidatus Krumholzibacteria bacterium]|nr:hypothetical protein [Candidatus Krumholzibacteria bacterium]
MLVDLLELPFQRRDALVDLAAVDFQLSFAGAARADTAGLALEVLPEVLEPRERVFELRKLDLDLRLLCFRVTREDVEDQFGAIDAANVEALFEVLGLRGGEVVVENDEIDPELLASLFEIIDFAVTDVGGDVDPGPALDSPADDQSAGGQGKL